MTSFLNYILPITIFIQTFSTHVKAQNFGQCKTPDNQSGQCILLAECQSLYSTSTKPDLSTIERELLERSQCGLKGKNILVCCPFAAAALSAGDDTSGSNLLPVPGVCGVGNIEKVFGGSKTKIDEFPWIALLSYDKPGGRKGFHCGGFLINNRYILTASHCIKGSGIPADWRLTSVRLGEWDISKAQDCDEMDPTDCSDNPIDVEIEQSITYEDYDPSSRNQLHDIALLRLSQNVPYTVWIKPICLPVSEKLRSASFEGISLDVAGWGQTENISRSDVKLKARVDGVSLASCNNVYQSEGVTLENTQICAGGEKGIDTCRGDSGGPLIGLDLSNRMRPFYFAAGIVSFGPMPCGLGGWPGVFTRVGSYMDWILKNLRP